MAVTVNKNRCPQNHPCPSIHICPVNALTQQGFEAPSVDNSSCLDCGKCVYSCPMGAIQL